jgi:hypothetical protein
VKVIYIMRDPLQRLWSHVKFHAEFTGQAEMLRRMNPEELMASARVPHLWENSEYGKVVARLKRNTRDGELMLTFFEEIHSDPLGWLRRLESFLEIGPGSYDETLLSRRVNTSMEVDMPDFFPKIFAEDSKRIRHELHQLDVHPPSSWFP